MDNEREGWITYGLLGGFPKFRVIQVPVVGSYHDTCRVLCSSPLWEQ